MIRAPRAAMLAAGAALAVAAAGCGGGGDGDGAAGDDPLQRTIARAAKADDGLGVRFAFRGSTMAFGDTIPLRGYGQLESGERRGRLVVVAGGGREESFVDGSSVVAPVGSIRAGVLEGVPRTADWLRIDQREVTGALGGGPTAVVAAGPTESLELLSLAGAEVRDDGRERVRGVATRRYRVTLPYGRYIDAAAGRLDDPLDCPDFIRDATLRLMLWIDGDDLLRRARLRQASEGLSVSLTMDITRYERSLRVRLPAERTIYDATSELAKLAAADAVGRDRSGEC